MASAGTGWRGSCAAVLDDARREPARLPVRFPARIESEAA